MRVSLGEIAKEVCGLLIGSPEKVVTGVALIDDATEDQITLADGQQTLWQLQSDPEIRAGAVIVPSNYEGARPNVIKVGNPQLACVKLIRLFHPPKPVAPGISPKSEIHDDARLGENIFVGPFVSIGARSVIGDGTVIHAGVVIGDDVVIGSDSTLFHRVVVHSRTRIGNRVVIRSGSVIGCDGFGYVEDGEELHRIPHVGEMIVEDDVEIGCNNTIARGNLGRTLIQQGVKTGNLVEIAHNVNVGRNTRIVAQAGIAGNTIIGNKVTIGGQAGIEQNLLVGDAAVIGPQAGVIADVAEGAHVYGTPGMSLQAWLKSGILIPRLSQMRREISHLNRQLDAVGARGGNQD